LPEIVIGEPTKASPSVLIVGGSGSGKTHAIAELLKAGKTGLILAVEAKTQILLKHRPMIVYVAAPVTEGGKMREPTPTEKFNRLKEFRDRLASGEYREHEGKKIDFLATDGVMELMQVFYGHHKLNRPVDRDGAPNTYAMYDAIGESVLDFLRTLRDAASEAASLYGTEPLGIIATCGEEWEKKKGEEGRYVPLLKGNIVPRNLPYQFEMVLRLDTEAGLDGGVQYVAHTVRGAQGEWFAKTPGGLLPPKIVLGPGAQTEMTFNDIYDRLTALYRGEEEKV
jgi:hypothetical protein